MVSIILKLFFGGTTPLSIAHTTLIVARIKIIDEF